MKNILHILVKLPRKFEIYAFVLYWNIWKAQNTDINLIGNLTIKEH